MEISGNKVSLVKMSQYDPSTHPAQKITRWTATITKWGVQHDQDHDQEGFQQPITFRRVSQSGQVEIKIE